MIIIILMLLFKNLVIFVNLNIEKLEYCTQLNNSFNINDIMSRTIMRTKSKNRAREEELILNILAGNGYQQKFRNGEVVYQKGDGFVFVPKFIKYTFHNDELILEGWVKNLGILGESDLEGFISALPKQNCKDIMLSIMNAVGF